MSRTKFHVKRRFGVRAIIRRFVADIMDRFVSSMIAVFIGGVVSTTVGRPFDALFVRVIRIAYHHYEPRDNI
jgi:hypothetical protein